MFKKDPKGSLAKADVYRSRRQAVPQGGLTPGQELRKELEEGGYTRRSSAAIALAGLPTLELGALFEDFSDWLLHDLHELDALLRRSLRGP